MKVVHCDNIPFGLVEMDGARGVRLRCLIGPEDGAPSFTMREFEIAPGGCTPKHTHRYEHEVYVLEGNGVVLVGGDEHPLRPGTVALVPPEVLHQFRNTGSARLRFLCLIPHPVRGTPTSCVAACGCE